MSNHAQKCGRMANDEFMAYSGSYRRMPEKPLCYKLPERPRSIGRRCNISKGIGRVMAPEAE